MPLLIYLIKNKLQKTISVLTLKFNEVLDFIDIINFSSCSSIKIKETLSMVIRCKTQGMLS
jgi:hypothetical protein